MDEQPVQLLKETRLSIAATKDHGKRILEACVSVTVEAYGVHGPLDALSGEPRPTTSRRRGRCLQRLGHPTGDPTFNCRHQSKTRKSRLFCLIRGESDEKLEPALAAL